MPELGEAVAAGVVKDPKPKYLLAAIEKITFESGINIFDVEAGGAEKALPPSGTPHWGGAQVHPAVYVRQGGSGETKGLKVKVKWNQKDCDGAGKLKGTSADGKIVIEGDFNVNGEKGDAEVACTFTTKPDVVANYGKGVGMKWTVEAAGETVTAPGGGPLKLFFVDGKPRPVGWSYKKHYLKVIDWTTAWAAGKSGSAAVFNALWDKFSDGSGARVPHVTGFSYWKTNDPVQDLKTLITPKGPVLKKGWSCRAIAHLFMECMVLHGMKCLEVIPETPDPGTYMFLVQNWEKKPAPIPNWEQWPDVYYGGSWVPSEKPPLNVAASTSLKKKVIASGPVAPGGDSPTAETKDLIQIDLKKKSGVPAQGQPKAPLGFSNHWIVQAGGSLYDTSYGAKHANDIVQYGQGAVAGWLVGMLEDEYKGGFLWLKKKKSRAWLCRALSQYNLVRNNGNQN